MYTGKHPRVRRYYLLQSSGRLWVQANDIAQKTSPLMSKITNATSAWGLSNWNDQLGHF